VEDVFLGLGVDQEGQPEMTGKRMNTWVAQIMKEFAVT
jgi:hypothetical protein